MNELNYVEFLGYIASIFIAISITMKSFIKLRVLNFIGAVLLGTYGVFIESLPIVLVNYFIGATNIYFIWKYYKKNLSSN